MAIRWSDDLATGIADVDREHRVIYERIAHLVESVERDDAAATARRVAVALKHHVVNHFADEAETMVALSYPAMEEHQAEHQEILSHLIALEEELSGEGSEPALLVAATRVLSNWILTHTTTFDRDFARFVRSTRDRP